jgi:hypothetical protein
MTAGEPPSSEVVRWLYYEEGGAAAGSSAWFEDRARAEAWISETWQELLDGGVATVALVDGAGREAYRMPLGEG